MGAKQPGGLMWSPDQRELQKKWAEKLDADTLEEMYRQSPKPRDLLNVVCAQIGAEFTTDGFRYLRSTRTLRKQSSDLTMAMSFGTSRHNTRDWSVIVCPAAFVVSKQLNDWRLKHPKCSQADDHSRSERDPFFGCLIHNLLEEHEYANFPPVIEWNVARSDTRQATIDDIVAFLRAHVLTFFEQFTDQRAVITALICGAKYNRGSTSIPGFEVDDAVEYALCFGTIQQASAILFRYHQLNTNLRGTDVEKRFATFRQDGLSKQHLDGPGFPNEMDHLKQTYSI